MGGPASGRARSRPGQGGEERSARPGAVRGRRAPALQGHQDHAGGDGRVRQVEDPGAQTAQAQIDATLCKLPVDTNAQRPVVHVAFVLTQPFNPDVQVYRNPVTNRCELSMKNQDPVLNAYMQLWQGAGPYDFYDPLYPGTPYTFRRHAPRKLWFSTNFYDPTVMKSGADIYGILSGELNTVKCTVKIFQSYK